MNRPLYPSARNAATVVALALALGFSGCKSAAPPPDDASLTTAVQSRIAGDVAISNEPIQTSVQNGVATLNGNVSNDAARSLAARDAAQVAGIRTVVNNLMVQPPPAPAATQVVTPPDAPVRAIRKPAPAPESRSSARTQQPPPPPEPPPVQQPAPVQRAQAQPPAAPPPPAFRDITVPSGTTLPIRITQTLDSATTQQGDTFNGVVASDVFIDGLNVIPQGTPVSGRVDAVQEAAHFKGNSLLTIEVTSINRPGQRIPVATESFSKAGDPRGKNTAEKVGGGAAIGAILGAIFGGGKGAAVGAAAGGGLGAGAQAITRGQQVQIPSETLIRFRTTSAISVHTSTQSGPSVDPTLQHHPTS